MAEAALESTAESNAPRPGRRAWLRRNPIVLKELRSRMRGRRAFVSLTIYLVFLSGFVSLVYASSASAINAFGSPSDWQRLGKAVFFAVVGLELFMLCFIAPGVTAGAISSERERQTFDVLRVTLLSARSLVLGKLVSGFSFLFLLLLAAIPLQSLAFLFGGITLEEVVIGSAMLVVTALTFSALGLFVSSLVRRTQASTVLAYTLALVLTIGLPLVTVLTTPFLSSSLFINRSASADPASIVSLYWILLSISPLSAAVASEVTLATGESVFHYTMPLGGGVSIQLLAPWIIYIVAYLSLSALLLWWSVRNVNRPEK